MSRLLGRLADAIGRHPLVIIACWVAILVAAVPLAVRSQGVLSNGGFEVNGSDSQRILATLEEAKVRGAQPFTLVVRVTDPATGDAELADLKRLFLATIAGQDATPPQFPFGASASADGRVRVVTGYGDYDQNVALDIGQALGRVVGPRGDAERYVVGPAMTYAAFQARTTSDLRAAEELTLPIVAIVLVLLFGSLVASFLPLILAAASVAVALALTFVVASYTEVSIFATTMITMIGIGVAVDYSLFVLARFREELAGGRDRSDAVRVAMETSGTSVVFSGLTVVISLLAILLVPVRAVQSMAAAAAVVTAVAVVAATTALPALLHLLGTRVNRLSVRRPRVGVQPRAGGGAGRCSSCVDRAPSWSWRLPPSCSSQSRRFR